MLSLGLNMQWGFTGLPNFGYHAFFGIGAYSSAILTGMGQNIAFVGANIGWGFLVGALVSVLAALALGVVTLRLRGYYFFIAAWSFGNMIYYVFNNELSLTNGPYGITAIPRLFGQLRGISYEFAVVGLIAVVVIMSYVFLQRIVNSPYGRVLRALREDEIATRAVGKNVLRFRVECFVVSAVLASVAGSLYAHYLQFVSPDMFTDFITFYIMISLLVGGIGSNKGAIIGALAIEGLYDGLRLLSDYVGVGPLALQFSSIRIIIVAVLLALMIKLRPQGILGKK